MAMISGIIFGVLITWAIVSMPIIIASLIQTFKKKKEKPKDPVLTLIQGLNEATPTIQQETMNTNLKHIHEWMVGIRYTTNRTEIDIKAVMQGVKAIAENIKAGQDFG